MAGVNPSQKVRAYIKEWAVSYVHRRDKTYSKDYLINREIQDIEKAGFEVVSLSFESQYFEHTKEYVYAAVFVIRNRKKPETDVWPASAVPTITINGLTVAQDADVDEIAKRVEALIGRSKGVSSVPSGL